MVLLSKSCGFILIFPMKRVTGGTPWHDGNIHGFFQPIMERPTVMAIYQLEVLRKPHL